MSPTQATILLILLPFHRWIYAMAKLWEMAEK